MLNPRPVRGNEASVACGSCRACCHQIVILDDAEIGYDVETIATPSGPVRLLRRNPDGSCAYLVDGNCSIYEARPACCRVFDCGAWYRRTLPALRKASLAAGGQIKRMVKEGRRRAEPAFTKEVTSDPADRGARHRQTGI